MTFSSKNADRWVASESGKVVAAADKLENVFKMVEGRKNLASICFDLMPQQQVRAAGV